jgi:type II secretory pathway pseudopilin PulG
MPLRKTKQSSKLGISLVEVLIVLAILLILAGLLFPTFRGAQDASKRTVTMSRLKQVYQALVMYGGDYDVHDEVPGLGSVPAYPLEQVMVLNPYGAKGDILHSAVFPDVGKKKYFTSFAYFWVSNFIHREGPGVGISEQNRARLKEEQSDFVIISDLIHDYFEFWPQEKDSDPYMQRRFEINLRVSGSVKPERRPGQRGVVLPYWTA